MRTIDGKFHIDDEARLIKTGNGEEVPHDEPLFLLRGRDHLAIRALEFYAELCNADGCNDFQMDGVNRKINEFHDFAETHKSKMKQPGITRGK